MKQAIFLAIALGAVAYLASPALRRKVSSATGVGCGGCTDCAKAAPVASVAVGEPAPATNSITTERASYASQPDDEPDGSFEARIETRTGRDVARGGCA